MSRTGDRAHLDAWWNVVDDADGLAVGVPRQRVGDDVVLHLAGGLVARLHAIDGLAGGALEAAVLVAVVVHGHQAQQMVQVAALAKLADQLWLDALVTQQALVARRRHQPLHADGAVLKIMPIFFMTIIIIIIIIVNHLLL